MKNLVTLSLLSFKLAYKRGMILGLSILAVVLVFLFFHLGASTGELMSEYPNRIQFALWGLFTLFAPAMLWVCVLSIRNDYQGQQLPMLTTLPVSRSIQFLGRWMGSTVACLIPMGIGLILLGVIQHQYVRSFPEKDQVDFHQRFDYPRCTRSPSVADQKAQIKAELKKLDQDGLIKDDEEREYMRNEIIEKYKLVARSVPENGKIVHTFETEGLPSHQPLFFDINYRALDRVNGSLSRFTLTNDRGVVFFTDTAITHPYYGYALPIPPSAIPNGENWLLEMQGIEAQSMVFIEPYQVKIYYLADFAYHNVLLLVIFTILWTSAFVALALTVATHLSFTVASFVLGCIWMMGLMTPFFRDLSKSLTEYGVRNQMDGIFAIFLDGICSILQVFSTPFGIESYAKGEMIRWQGSCQSWVVAAILVTFIALCIGMTLLKNREICSEGTGGEV